MVYGFLMFVHVTSCLHMILVVLLQTGRGAGLMVFGGGGDSLINTPSGSSFMKKFTAGLAITFACTSLLMTLHSSRSGMSSVTSRVAAPAAQPAPRPAQPAAAPAQAPAEQKSPAPLPAPEKK